MTATRLNDTSQNYGASHLMNAAKTKTPF